MKNKINLPKNSLVLTISLGINPDTTFTRILDVISLVSNVPVCNFPDDDYWQINLPSWLLDKLPILSEEECQILLDKTPRELWNTLPWEFGSWIDAIKDRGWEWHNYIRDGNIMYIILIRMDIPERIDALKHVIITAGGDIIDEYYNARCY